MGNIIELPIEVQAQQLVLRFKSIWSRFYDLSVERELKDFAVGDWVISHFYPEKVLKIGKESADVLLFGQTKQKREWSSWNPQRAIPVSEEEARFIILNYWAWRYWMIAGEDAVLGVLLRDTDMINTAIHAMNKDFDRKVNKAEAA